jgi:hypothetical protein
MAGYQPRWKFEPRNPEVPQAYYRPQPINLPSSANVSSRYSGSLGGGSDAFSVLRQLLEQNKAKENKWYNTDVNLDTTAKNIEQNLTDEKLFGAGMTEQKDIPLYLKMLSGGAKGLNVLDAPRQALYGGVDALINGENVLEGAKEQMAKGFALKDTLDMSELFTAIGARRPHNTKTGMPESMNDVQDDVLRFVRGLGVFAGNVVTDPITWASFGLGGLAKGGATAVANEVKEAGIRQMLKQTMVKKAVSGADDVLKKSATDLLENLGDVARAGSIGPNAIPVAADAIPETADDLIGYAVKTLADDTARGSLDDATRNSLLDIVQKSADVDDLTRTADSVAGDQRTIGTILEGTFKNTLPEMQARVPKLWQQLSKELDRPVDEIMGNPQLARLVDDFATKGQKDYSRLALQAPFLPFRAEAPFGIGRKVADMFPSIRHSQGFANAFRGVNKGKQLQALTGSRLGGKVWASADALGNAASNVSEIARSSTPAQLVKRLEDLTQATKPSLLNKMPWRHKRSQAQLIEFITVAKELAKRGGEGLEQFAIGDLMGKGFRVYGGVVNGAEQYYVNGIDIAFDNVDDAQKAAADLTKEVVEKAKKTAVKERVATVVSKTKSGRSKPPETPPAAAAAPTTPKTPTSPKTGGVAKAVPTVSDESIRLTKQLDEYDEAISKETAIIQSTATTKEKAAAATRKRSLAQKRGKLKREMQVLEGTRKAPATPVTEAATEVPVEAAVTAPKTTPVVDGTPTPRRRFGSKKAAELKKMISENPNGKKAKAAQKELDFRAARRAEKTAAGTPATTKPATVETVESATETALPKTTIESGTTAQRLAVRRQEITDDLDEIHSLIETADDADIPALEKRARELTAEQHSLNQGQKNALKSDIAHDTRTTREQYDKQVNKFDHEWKTTRTSNKSKSGTYSVGKLKVMTEGGTSEFTVKFHPNAEGTDGKFFLYRGNGKAKTPMKVYDDAGELVAQKGSKSSNAAIKLAKRNHAHAHGYETRIEVPIAYRRYKRIREASGVNEKVFVFEPVSANKNTTIPLMGKEVSHGDGKSIQLFYKAIGYEEPVPLKLTIPGVIEDGKVLAVSTDEAKYLIDEHFEEIHNQIVDGTNELMPVRERLAFKTSTWAAPTKVKGPFPEITDDAPILKPIKQKTGLIVKKGNPRAVLSETGEGAYSSFGNAAYPQPTEENLVQFAANHIEEFSPETRMAIREAVPEIDDLAVGVNKSGSSGMFEYSPGRIAAFNDALSQIDEVTGKATSSGWGIEGLSNWTGRDVGKTIETVTDEDAVSNHFLKLTKKLREAADDLDKIEADGDSSIDSLANATNRYNIVREQVAKHMEDKLGASPKAAAYDADIRKNGTERINRSIGEEAATVKSHARTYGNASARRDMGIPDDYASTGATYTDATTKLLFDDDKDFMFEFDDVKGEVRLRLVGGTSDKGSGISLKTGAGWIPVSEEEYLALGTPRGFNNILKRISNEVHPSEIPEKIRAKYFSDVPNTKSTTLSWNAKREAEQVKWWDENIGADNAREELSREAQQKSAQLGDMGDFATKRARPTADAGYGETINPEEAGQRVVQTDVQSITAKAKRQAALDAELQPLRDEYEQVRSDSNWLDAGDVKKKKQLQDRLDEIDETIKNRTKIFYAEEHTRPDYYDMAHTSPWGGKKKPDQEGYLPPEMERIFNEGRTGFDPTIRERGVGGGATGAVVEPKPGDISSGVRTYEPLEDYAGNKYHFTQELTPDYKDKKSILVHYEDAASGGKKIFGRFDDAETAIEYINMGTGKDIKAIKGLENGYVDFDELDKIIGDMVANSGGMYDASDVAHLQVIARQMVDAEQELYEKAGSQEIAHGIEHDIYSGYSPGYVPKELKKNAVKSKRTRRLLEIADIEERYKGEGSHSIESLSGRGPNDDLANAGTRQARFNSTEANVSRMGDPSYTKPTEYRNLNLKALKEGELYETNMGVRAGERIGGGIEDVATNDIVNSLGAAFGRPLKRMTQADGSYLFQDLDDTWKTFGEITGNTPKGKYVTSQDRSMVYRMSSEKIANDIWETATKAAGQNTGELAQFRNMLAKFYLPLMTLARPAFIVTNTVGNIDFALRNGRIDPQSLMEAGRVIGAMGNLMRGGDNFTTKILGETVNSHELAQKLTELNVIIPNLRDPMYAEMTQLVGGVPGLLDMPVTGKYLGWMRNINASSENFFRSTVFLSAKRQGYTDAQAAQEVNRVMLDYAQTSLTDFEQKVRSVIPFYTFARRNLPASAAFMMERPGLAAAMYANGPRYLSESSETNPDGSPKDMSPGEYLERWQGLSPSKRESLVMPLFGKDSMQATRLPLNDFFQYAEPISEAVEAMQGKGTWNEVVEQGRQTLGEQIAPPVKAISELLTGSDFETGMQLGEGSRIQGLQEALKRNVPILGQAYSAWDSQKKAGETSGYEGNPNALKDMARGLFSSQWNQPFNDDVQSQWDRQWENKNVRDYQNIAQSYEQENKEMLPRSITDMKELAKTRMGFIATQLQNGGGNPQDQQLLAEAESMLEPFGSWSDVPYSTMRDVLALLYSLSDDKPWVEQGVPTVPYGANGAPKSIPQQLNNLKMEANGYVRDPQQDEISRAILEAKLRQSTTGARMRSQSGGW